MMNNGRYNNLTDFNIICRICLEKKANLNSIFGATVAKMVMACASVIVIEGDGLPDKICTQCTLLVSRAYRFKELCEKSEVTLRQYIDSTKLTNDIMKPELLLVDNSLVNEHCSIFTDIFMKNDVGIPDPMILEPSVLSTDVTALEASMTEQCLPSLWNLKRVDDFCPDHLNPQSFCDNTLQSLNLNKDNRETWNPETELHDIDSSTYSKSYIDLDHSSRLIHEYRTKKENKSFSHCGISLTDGKLFKNHTQESDLEKRHMCSTCGKRYKENKLLLIHMRSHTGERPFACAICNKTFAQYGSLHKHRQIHSGQKRHQCPICDQTFFQLSNLNIHMRNHTGKQLYLCTICGKKFTTKRVLEQHTLIHNGAKPFGCLHCELTFRTKALRNRHSQVHSGEKRYMCTTCGRSFRNKEMRDTHTRSHTGERPFSCTICAKSYIARSHLRTHMLVHTGERRHVCVHCNQYFMQQRHLTAHLRRHTGEKPFTCFICHRNFCHSGSLSTHMKTHKTLLLQETSF